MGTFSVSTPRVTNMLTSQLILSNLNSTASELLKIQEKISSGRNILTPSDNPFSASIAMQLQSQLEQKAVFQTNVNNAMSVLSMADATLAQANELVNEVYALGLGEIGVTASAETRASTATVVDQILAELVAIANTQFAGKYLFAGRDTRSAPFELVDGGVYFAGDTGTLDVSIDYHSISSTSVDAAAAFSAVSTQVKGAADLNPTLTLDALLADLNGGDGVEPGAIVLSDGIGTYTIDLSGAATVGDVVAAITAATPPTITASVLMAGAGLQIQAIGGNLTITSAQGGSTAADLGIERLVGAGTIIAGYDINPLLTKTTDLLAVTGVDWASGMAITNGTYSAVVDFSACLTIQDVLNEINGAGLYVEAAINADGSGIDIVSRLSGGNLQIGENSGTTASDLGLRTMDLSTRLSTLNSGSGMDTVTGDDVSITLTDGTTFGVDLSGAATLGDVILAINTAPGNPGTLAAGLAATGNGVVLVDTSGGAGTFSVARANFSNAAEDLGLMQTTTGSFIAGGDVSGTVPDGLFSHLLGLREALLANDENAISYYTDGLDGDLSPLLNIRASIGARQQRMETVRERTQNEVLELQSMLSERVDLDYAGALVRYSTLQASYQAALQTAASFLQMSLMDFLR